MLKYSVDVSIIIETVDQMKCWLISISSLDMISSYAVATCCFFDNNRNNLLNYRYQSSIRFVVMYNSIMFINVL